MLTLRKVHKRFGAYICRRCINRRYQADLSSRDCRYAPEEYVCPDCEREQRIVKGLHLSGHLKMLFK